MTDQQSGPHSKANSWQEFLDRIQSVFDVPLKVKDIKKIIKISDKVFPSNQCLLNHYKNKFST